MLLSLNAQNISNWIMYNCCYNYFHIKTTTVVLIEIFDGGCHIQLLKRTIVAQWYHGGGKYRCFYGNICLRWSGLSEDLPQGSIFSENDNQSAYYTFRSGGFLRSIGWSLNTFVLGAGGFFCRLFLIGKTIGFISFVSVHTMIVEN